MFSCSSEESDVEERRLLLYGGGAREDHGHGFVVAKEMSASVRYAFRMNGQIHLAEYIGCSVTKCELLFDTYGIILLTIILYVKIFKR